MTRPVIIGSGPGGYVAAIRAAQLGMEELAIRANDLAQRARDKRLKPDEIQRGTFTITNPGVYGSLFGTPIINQAQVAILCVGAIDKRSVVEKAPDGTDAVVIRSRAYMALTCDHRLIDGADAELFIADVRSQLEGGDWHEIEALV
ncbi:MAG: 2-oxo acid dehydrogenase subunit E2 [Acidobacteriota bacterium]|nr:2-oxo acid dehydrogenase subunit E2 [Acidobacteriota bacterium]